MSTAPLLQQKSHSQILPQFSQHRHHRSLSTSSDTSNAPSSTSTMKKSHLALARIVLVICISSVLMVLVHIHYTKVYRQARGETVTHDGSNINNDNDPFFSDNTQTKQPEHEFLPPYEPYSPAVPETKPETEAPAPPPMEPKFTVTETQLTTTTRYSNGTMKKVFKPEFYTDAKAAQKEMGSFLDTLAKRAWWTHNPDSIEGETTTIEHGTPPTDVFFAYLPMGGGNNQFTSLQKAALLAKDLKRTLLIPPISPNSHIKVKMNETKHRSSG
ncbi:hypothetical protein EDD21DRAFT_144649 [Dissophora ornata]|nr:hypothetical protein EDD21DRAFT_144649 [Dissophora ornata]